jgi:hypothetical protein
LVNFHSVKMQRDEIALGENLPQSIVHIILTQYLTQ